MLSIRNAQLEFFGPVRWLVACMLCWRTLNIALWVVILNLLRFEQNASAPCRIIQSPHSHLPFIVLATKDTVLSNKNRRTKTAIFR